MAKFAEKKAVGFVLAPLNLKPLSLVGPVPQASALGRCPAGGVNFAAYRRAKLVRALQHSVKKVADHARW